MKKDKFWSQSQHSFQYLPYRHKRFHLNFAHLCLKIGHTLKQIAQ